MIQYTVHRKQYMLQNTLDTVHSIEYTIHRIQYTVNRKQYMLQNTLDTVHSKQYTIHSIQYTVHRKQYMLQNTLDTVHSIQYTVYSTWQCVDVPRMIVWTRLTVLGHKHRLGYYIILVLYYY